MYRLISLFGISARVDRIIQPLAGKQGNIWLHHSAALFKSSPMDCYMEIHSSVLPLLRLREQVLAILPVDISLSIYLLSH